MAAPVNATINVLANTNQAVAQFKSLQAQVAQLNKTFATTSGAAVAQQAALNKALMDGANASRMWSARIVPMNTAVNQFSDALDKGKMSLGQYTRYAASQLPGMSRVFKREFDVMTRAAEQNVKRMQTQYVQLGNSATGAAQAMAFTPTALNKYAASAEIAAQRQMMMNRMIDLGTTKLLNWGKNTQWAGRQLMVGFSIPLAMMGAAAAKAFKEIDQGSIAFKRVYGDLQTTTAEMERNLDAVKDLGIEYTRYGKSLASTIDLAAKVAATGARNESLTAATEQTIRLATLGLMEYDEALEATISLQTAFQVSNEDLAGTIDFLNVVENETILTMQDMAAAIPRVAPVVKGLGGDVKDLAVFMTALREGGVSAEQGANALKSGLGRLINPTKAAREEAEKYGISIEAIVQRNRGDLMGTVTEFGKALSTLGQLEQQQVLQKVFGTYQYARLGALFTNLSNDAGQAQRTIELTSMSVEDLASISERELGKIEEATSVKFQAAIEKLKVAIAPIGETFMKALTPIIDTVSKILNAFNDLPDGVKNAIAIAVGAIAGIGPIILMTVGLIANGIANIGKLIQTIRKFFARLKGDASLFNYLTAEEQEAAAAANNLEAATGKLTAKFLGQQQALERLIQLVGAYSKALGTAAASMPLGMGVGVFPTAKGQTGSPKTGGPMKMAKGGIVPGVGNKDTVAAMLTPGESVVTKEATQKYGPMIQAMNAGTIPGFVDGVVSVKQSSQSTKMEQFQSQKALVAGHLGGGIMVPVKAELARVQANLGAFSSAYVEQLRRMDASGQQFVRVYTNLVALMSQELNEDIKNGNANIARVKAEIGNPAAQVELKRQLQLLGMQDDEIAQVLNRYVANLNSQLDAAQNRLGSGNLSAAQMDRALKRAAVGAAGKTFTDPVQRAMFARLATDPTTYLSDEGKGRKTMQSRSASRMSPESRSYVNLRRTKGYGISAATKFSAADIASAGYNPTAMRKIFNDMPLAAQQAVIATKGNLEKALPIFMQYGLKAGDSYSEGLVSAISKGKPNVSQAVSKNRQAASPAPWAAPMGREDGNAYGKGFTSAASQNAATIRQSILSSGGQQPLPGAAKQAYRLAQSTARREAYNIKEMQRIGMTDAQIIRQLDRLKASKEKQAQSQKAQAKISERNARLAQINANLAQQSGTQMAVEEQARRRGLKTRVSEYFATPVGDGTRTRGQAIRGRLASGGGGATMGLMGLTMAASMAGGSVGEMAQKIAPVATGLMGLQMILPMLTNPIGLAIIAIGGLTAGFIYLRKQLDDTAREAAKMGANIGGVANGMKIIEEATGFKPPALEDRLFRFTEEDRKAMGEFASYFESEAGSKFIQDLKEASSEERYERVSALLAQAIGSGLEEEKAKAFGFAIAEATGDALLKSGIARDFANQVFKSGSEALINLEESRMQKAPDLQISARSDFASGVIGQARFEQTALWDAFDKLNPLQKTLDIVAQGLAAFAGETFMPFTQNKREQDRVAAASKGLGFVLQTIQNLTNAEAILEEERRKGLITIKEYTDRSDELNTLQLEAADYIGKIFSLGADSGSMLTALGDQLSFAGFSEDQIGRITTRFNPDALAKQFFGEDKTFATLGVEQQDYVEQVLTKTLSGLTPENVEQRLQDVEGTYTAIAEKVVQSMIDGTFAGLDFSFNQQNIEDYINQRMGGATGATMSYNVPALAKNLLDADNQLKKLGTDSMEVFTRLTEFTDQDFAKGIMASKTQILEFGEAVAKLAEYEDINIELVMKKGIDPDTIVKTIDKINNMKLDPDIFGPMVLDVDKLVNSLIEAGMEVDDFPNKLKAGTDAIAAFGDKAVDSLGNIKPTIVPKIIANVLGDQVDNPQAVANALDSAFPDGLKPIDLAILLTLDGDPAAIALLSNPQAMAAAARGESTFTETVVVGGEVFRRQIGIPQSIQAIAPFLTGGAKGDKEESKKDTSSGGGTKEDPLKDFRDAIMERLAMYTNIEKLVKQLGNKKKVIEKAMGKIRYSGSFVDQLRQMNISEQLISELLSKGYKNAKEIVDRLGTKGLQRLDISDMVGRAALSTSEAVGAARTSRRQARAAQILRQRGITDQEAVESIAGDPDKAEQLLALVAQVKKGLKGSKGALDEFINAQLESVRAAREQEAAISGINPAIEEAKNAQQEYYDQQMAFFDEQYAGIEMLANAEFKARTGMTVSAMELQIKKNEDLIDTHRDEIRVIEDSIRAIETKQGKAANYSDWGLEQLEKEIKSNQENIRNLERINELTQRRIDKLKREDELRNRESEAITKDLEKLSEAENQIRESYDKRVEALDKVAEINDYIINQQKQQIDLSKAVSEGDIYAATQAAQQMRAESSRFASDQLRAGLETGMEAQIANLRTAGGLTRDQAEERIAAIKEQSYQTSLSIRDLEDEIYNRQINEILPLRDKEYNLNIALEKVQGQIVEKQLQIRDIERSKIEPLTRQNELYTEQIDDLLLDIETQQLNVKNAAGQTKDEVEMLNGWIMAGLISQEQMTRETVRASSAANTLASQWVQVGDAINAAKEALTKEYKRIDLKPLGPDYTEDQRNAEKAKAKAAYDAAISLALGKAPSIDASLFSGIPTSQSSGATAGQKVPSENARWIMMPGGGKLAGQAFDEGIIYLDKNGRFRWTKTNKLVPTMPNKDMTKYYSGGFVLGNGARDSVSAMLTPGEFVIRKAMVDKYGMPMMKSLNQGSFAMPRYETGPTTPQLNAVTSTNVSSINAPVYNTYDMKFSITGTNQSADEIANKVMFKMKQLQGQQIRGNRGY